MMKKGICFGWLMSMLMLFPVVNADSFQKKISPVEEKSRIDVAAQSDKVLEGLVGNWKAEYTENGKKVVTTLSIRRVVQGKYLEGILKTIDEKKNVLFESLMIYSFNLGSMNYLVFSFESTGWAKTFIGPANEKEIAVQGVTPEGIEFYRWRVLEDGRLERAHWDPVPGTAKPKGNPSQIILFEPV